MESKEAFDSRPNGVGRGATANAFHSANGAEASMLKGHLLISYSP